jgi:hypothetical protein
MSPLVTPPAGGSPRPSAFTGTARRDPAPSAGDRPGKARGLLALLLGLLLLLSFVVVSSLVAELTESTVARLAVGLTSCLLLPLLLAAWSRGRARARDRRGLSSRAALGLASLLLVGGAALIAPRQTRAALERHGAWWVAALSRSVGADPRNALVRTAQDYFGWLGGLLPRSGAGPGPSPRLTREAGPVVRTDGGAPLPREAGRPDSRRPDARRGEAGAAVGGEVRIAIQRQSGAVIVPVRLQHGAQEVSAKMVFDTGASLTTLSEATLRRLGLVVSPDDATVETHTANGKVRRSLSVIDTLWLGGAQLTGGLTVAVCDPCAQGEVIGLLGLNVSGQFRVTLDQDALVLQPKAERNRLSDILPWVELKEASGTWRGPLLTVDLTVENRAPRALRNVRVAAVVKDGAREGTISADLAVLSARGRAPLRVQGLPPMRGSKFLLRLERAEW